MGMQVAIPRAVQLVLDDVGWREGWRLDGTGGPFRAGIDRLLDVRDYEAIADIGEAVGTRPTAAMILCEWDRENVCARHPTSTQSGAAWDNSARAGPWSEEAADVFLRRAQHIELALHGVGHEHWEDGVPTRAESYGAKGVKRDWAGLRGHLDCFRAILDQHGLGPEAGHRFPIHCVPAAFCYLWDENDPTDTGALMAAAGVELISTPFSSGGFHRRTPLLAPDGGVDHGLLVIDRGNTGVPWYALDSVPSDVGGGISGTDSHDTTRGVSPRNRGTVRFWSICGIHWPNILREDPEENHIAVRRWIDYLRAVAEQPGVMLAANVRECFAQWAYHAFGRVEPTEGGFVLDTTAVPDALLDVVGDMPVVIEIASADEPVSVSSNALRPVWYRHQDATAYVAFARPGRTRAEVTVETAREPIEPVVLRDGTFNVLHVRPTQEGVDIELEVFGTQGVPIAAGFAPTAVESVDDALSVERHSHDPTCGVTTVSVSGRDIQGHKGTIRLLG